MRDIPCATKYVTDIKNSIPTGRIYFSENEKVTWDMSKKTIYVFISQNGNILIYYDNLITWFVGDRYLFPRHSIYSIFVFLFQ